MKRNTQGELHDATVRLERLKRRHESVVAQSTPADEGSDAEKLSAVIRAIYAVTDVECPTKGVSPEEIYNSTVNAISGMPGENEAAPNVDPEQNPRGRGALAADSSALLNEARMHHWQLSRVLQALQVVQGCVPKEHRNSNDNTY